MLAIARPFVGICLLRVAPQDLPASAFLLAITVGAHAALGTVVTLLYLPPLTAFAASVAETLLLGLLAFGLLAVRGLRERFPQTFTAFAGSGAVLEAVALPVLLFLESVDPAGEPSAGSLLRTLPWLALLVWSWVVSGHILRHALSVHLAAGIAISMAFSWLSATLFLQFFGTH